MKDLKLLGVVVTYTFGICYSVYYSIRPVSTYDIGKIKWS